MWSKELAANTEATRCWFEVCPRKHASIQTGRRRMEVTVEGGGHAAPSTSLRLSSPFCHSDYALFPHTEKMERTHAQLLFVDVNERISL